jgi:hypothetical protein
MNWWTSIAFYLLQNSLRRWIEQPLALCAKITIAALIGLLGVVMIGGAGYLGDELERQLASRDALTIGITETISQRHVNARLALDDEEPAAWASLANEILLFDQLPRVVRIEQGGGAAILALRDPEALGYPDAVLLLSHRRPPGAAVVVSLDENRFEATVMRPRGDMVETAMGTREWVVTSSRRLAPLLQRGFTRNIVMQARSVDDIERVHEIADTMRLVEGRSINVRSSLPLLLELRRIQSIQRYVLVAVTIGTALVLGLVCGALAWMEFREERYLLALIRSFGVGRLMLLWHAVAENCLVAVLGVMVGLGLLAGFTHFVDLSAVEMQWLDGSAALLRMETAILLSGALCGGLLSCIPVWIGLRKPLGLVLK